MFSSLKKKYPEAIFVFKFLSIFCLLYFGTEFWIGITSPGNYYSKFCNDYLNYVRWYRVLILQTTKILCSLLGYDTYLSSTYNLKLVNGRGVNMVYSCIGYGIQSFWITFTISFPDIRLKKKIKWIIIGCTSLFLLNVLRTTILLIVANKYRKQDTFDSHHTIYNVITYVVVFIMIFFFLKKTSKGNEL